MEQVRGGLGPRCCNEPSPKGAARIGCHAEGAWPSCRRAFEMRRLASGSGPPMGAPTVRPDSSHRLVPRGWDTRRLQYKSQARAILMAAWRGGRHRHRVGHTHLVRGERRAGCAKPSPKGAVRLGVPGRGKLHGGASAASVRSCCDVLRAAGAPPMGARATLQSSRRRGPTSRAEGESERAVVGANSPHGKGAK